MRLWGQLWAWGLFDDGEYVSPVMQNGDGEYVYNETAEEECPSQGGIETAAGGFSWLGAKMYCDHKGMKLPTEAQWEAAARGQTFNEFPCGSDVPECWYGVYACCTEADTCGYAYYADLCHCCAPFESSVTDSCISPLGFLNMYGNASEWTSDYVDDGHDECVGGCVDPQPPEEPPSENAVHALKGGSMYSPYQERMRVAYREELNSDDGSSYSGVRCVRPDEPIPVGDAGTDGGSPDGGK
jgi:formylglycine-generating enzyme required for sulfatase activity